MNVIQLPLQLREEKQTQDFSLFCVDLNGRKLPILQGIFFDICNIPGIREKPPPSSSSSSFRPLASVSG